MQPTAAEIQRHAVDADGMRASADAGQRIDQHDGQAAIHQPARCGDAGGAGPDHGDVDTAHAFVMYA